MTIAKYEHLVWTTRVYYTNMRLALKEVGYTLINAMKSWFIIGWNGIKYNHWYDCLKWVHCIMGKKWMEWIYFKYM